MEQEEHLIVGSVEAVYYENPANFYKVMRISIDHDETELLLGHEIVVTGQFATIHLETDYQFFGNITNHPKYGEQFAVTRYQQKAPTSKEGLIEYLSSSRFKGIGPVLAERIVDHLGSDAIDKIIADKQSLENITGLSQARAMDLREALLQHQGTERIFIQLNAWGFGPKISEKIYRYYESKALEIIKENPYELIETIEGVGFNKADQLAEELGFEALAIERIAAGVYVSVYEMSNSEGDTFVPIENVAQATRKILETSRRQLIDDELIQTGIDYAINNERLVRLADCLMLPSLYYAEIGIVKRLKDYMEYEQVERFSDEEISAGIQHVIQVSGITYDQDQQKALLTAMKSPMSIITGGPGTGKTTLIKGLILLHSFLHEYNLEKAAQKIDTNPILLAAPTGRAAKRMQETTGLPASTIHRLLGYTIESNPEDFLSAELDGSLLIVDEMSMVDTWLMHWLVQAIPYHLQVVFVGDKDQLPSVGPGKVFSDLIASEIMPVLSLTKIYRQAHNSSIIDLAHAIRQGYLPDDFYEKKNDRTFIQASTQQIGYVVKQIVEMATKKGFDATSLQVLAPMYKGPAGINALNTLLQELLNPPKAGKREIDHFERAFRVGDKVLQLVNNSEEGVYNGDIGKIESIHRKTETESRSEEIVVSYEDDKELVYKKSELDQLTLAYCTSIHKAQGSEYPLVILPIVDTYSRLLQKDVLYTAVTRAQSSLIMLGNPVSFYKAVESKRRPRNTFLVDLLKVQFEGVDEDNGLEPIVASDDIQRETQTEIYDEIRLTPETIYQIDPMINMKGISPYDFMERKLI